MTIQERFKEYQELADLIQTPEFMQRIHKAGALFASAVKNGGKILFAGNGGSAADAQHFAGSELINRLTHDRPPQPAIALTADSNLITAVANDYGFEKIFSRQIEGLGKTGDVFVAISTSGNSKNILEACDAARKKQMKIVTFLGKGGGAMKGMGEIEFVIPSNTTGMIQQIHTFFLHTICEEMDNILEGKLRE